MMKSLCHEALGLLDAGEDFACLRIVESSGSTPRKEGASMILKKDGSIFSTIGGGRLEADALDIAKTAIEKRESREYRFVLSGEDAAISDMICGGEGLIQIDFISANDPKSYEIFRDAYETQGDTLILFGAGHVSCEIARAAEIAGFETIVIDDREEFANEKRFPNSEIIVTPSMKEIPALPINENSYLAIVTRGHLFDLDCLDWALMQKNPKPCYIGMIGSRRKIGMIYEKMKERGHSQDAIDEVFAPIGLDIGAATPGEIAISVAAQLIKERAGRA